MDDLNCRPTVGEARADLQNTSGVGGRNGAGTRCQDVADLALHEPVGRFWLCKIVGPGTPAAVIRLGKLDELDPRDVSEQRSWGAAHPLAVREVAGFVIGDGPLDPPPRRWQLHLG